MINHLVNSCIENAKALFQELAGEFYPFGYVITDSNEAIPYYVFFEDDFPNINEVLKQIATALIKDVENGKYLQGAVCVLSSKKVDGALFEFLDIKTLNDKNEMKDYIVLLDIDYKEYKFEILEVIERSGTIYAFNR